MTTITRSVVRDASVVSSVFVFLAACATGTMEGSDDYVGGSDSAGSGVTAGAATAGGSGGAATAGTGQSGSGSSGGSGGAGPAAGGAGGATGGTPGGGSGGGGATGGAAGVGGGIAGMMGFSGSPTSGGAGGSMTGGSSGAGGGAGKGGAGGSGGASAQGGSGSSGSAGAPAAGSGGSGGDPNCPAWPAANGSQSVSSTIQVSGTYDGALKRFSGSGPLGTGGQQENQSPLFDLANGATLKNVIIGSPAADGVHCSGACTLQNVWWEDVGEDAATFRGSSSSQQMLVSCGGAKNAADKIFQHNGAGTLTIENFTIEGFSKLYRSCGNCSTQYGRHVVLSDIIARSGSTLVGINTNYGDTADFERITIYGNINICERYTGNSTGAEPIKTGTGSDSQYCRYSDSDITRL